MLGKAVHRTGADFDPPSRSGSVDMMLSRVVPDTIQHHVSLALLSLTVPLPLALTDCVILATINAYLTKFSSII